jgi:hypothetical protein
MSLAREWRRQLFGASIAALIVPAAMFAALVVLALGGGFSQVGVLGQIFAGPPAVGAGATAVRGEGGAARALPVIPGVPVAIARRPPSHVIVSGRHRLPFVPNRTGGAIRSPAGTAPIVTGSHGGSGPPPNAPSRPAPSVPAAPTPSTTTQPAPPPTPQPQPTSIDQVVKVATQITQELPAPVGQAATQAVQAAGSAADGVLASVPHPPVRPGTLP